MLSPLQLKYVSFTEVVVRDNPDGNFANAPELRTNVQVPVRLDTERVWQLALHHQIKSNPGHNFAYDCEFGVVGIFELAPDFQPKDLTRLLSVNGASILYGAVREMAFNITARFPKGPLLLPTLNFQEILKSPEPLRPPHD
jgi:preprotein translocase subunit SecB